jgi:hypothetical protein
MTDRKPSFSFSGAYHPWAAVRSRNLVARLLRAVMMTVMGVAVIAGLVLLMVFAASVAVAALVAMALVGVYAAITRRPAHVRVHARDQSDGKGVYVARKSGSTWTVY